MADDITLVATPGRPTGSSASRRLRASGKIPGVLYGRGADPRSITVDWRDLRQALTTDKGLNALITLEVDGSSTQAIVKEMQRHPVRRDVLHVDFLAVDVDKPIATDVPINPVPSTATRSIRSAVTSYSGTSSRSDSAPSR